MNFQNSLWPHSGSSPSRMTLRHGRSSQLCGFRWEKAGFVVVGLGSWEGRNPERAGEKHAEIWEEGHGLRSVGTGRGQTSMLQKPEHPPQVPSSHWLCVPLFLLYPEAPRLTIPETPCPSDPTSHPFLVPQNHGVPQQPWYPVPPAIRSAAVTALNTQVGNLKPAQRSSAPLQGWENSKKPTFWECMWSWKKGDVLLHSCYISCLFIWLDICLRFSFPLKHLLE